MAYRAYFCMPSFLFLRYSEQFNLKYQGGTAGDAGLRELAVSHLRRDVHLPFVAHTHLLHGDNPSLNQVAQAEGYGRTAAATVKLLAVDGPSRVVRGDNAPWRGMLAVVLARCQPCWPACILSFPLLNDFGVKVRIFRDT